jgi:ribonucleoside-diphosphate reductase alpha chain
MERVENGEDWSLFDPKDVPELPDLFGDDFNARFLTAEASGLAKKTLPARKVYGRMMRTLAETGNGWITFKDKSNRACNQTAAGGTVHLSNLCTEILEVSSQEETAVCNLGSINLSRHMTQEGQGRPSFDFDKLARTVRAAIIGLDRVIDLNYYPIESTKKSNSRWRPVGLGLMGLQDVFFQLQVAFDSDEARTLSKKISEAIYFHALSTSSELARTSGRHAAFSETRAARGELQFDAWGVTPSEDFDWEKLRKSIVEDGLRNSLLVAIAPTATIASIAGCYECIEPQISNLFKRETLSGDFVQVNRYLVRALEEEGLWNATTRDTLKRHNGSVQLLSGLSDDMKHLFRTVWEVPMKGLIDMAADRGAFIDQSQSLNLFSENPNIGRLSSMYMYAWKKGLKTTYYLRSRPATNIEKTTLSQRPGPDEAEQTSAKIICSLENPESCEACQ